MVKNKILKRIVAGLSCIALSTTMLTSLPAFADDYVDEYQYYSTLDPNGEEYQEWKSNLASSAVSVPQNRMLKSILKNNTLIANDYIEFNTASNGHYTIGTIGGNPNSSTDDNKKMLFGHPGGGTSKTTIVVGESINEFTSSNVTYDADGSKDEKSPEITVESCNAGISNSNTINPNIVITNNSDKPLKMSDITINYVFNADNKENLEYHCDWLAVDNQYLGNTSVCEFVNDDYGNTYAKIKFNTDVELQPNKQFVIHFRLNAADWSNWDTSNDYSMGTEQLLPNDKIIVFYNEQLISGVQP
jgi:probably cellulosomal scaffolding protein, secreted; cellulose-binding and cohesin domain